MYKNVNFRKDWMFYWCFVGLATLAFYVTCEVSKCRWGWQYDSVFSLCWRHKIPSLASPVDHWYSINWSYEFVQTSYLTRHLNFEYWSHFRTALYMSFSTKWKRGLFLSTMAPSSAKREDGEQHEAKEKLHFVIVSSPSYNTRILFWNPVITLRNPR